MSLLRSTVYLVVTYPLMFISQTAPTHLFLSHHPLRNTIFKTNSEVTFRGLGSDIEKSRCE